MTEFNNQDIIIRNCSHFNNNLQIFANCCNKYYDCHMCHNESNNHRFQTYKIKKIKCINCNTENNLSNQCYNCKINFAEKFCNLCNIWTKDEFTHCSLCKVCVYGKKHKLYHCKKCNNCINIKKKLTHLCKEINIDNNELKNELKEDCPICLEEILIESDQSLKLLCNHHLHKSCYKQLIKNTNINKKIPRCTLCKKSIVSIKDYETIFDKKILENPMDSYYKNWETNITCNDCLTKSKINYHNIYHKCNNCNSYNTDILYIEKK